MVEETIFVLKLCTMISVCCVVQITLLFPNFKINTDAIGFFVTHPLTMIHILDFYSLYGVVYKAFVGNKKRTVGRPVDDTHLQNGDFDCQCVFRFPRCYFYVAFYTFRRTVCGNIVL